jgi:5-methylthioribose kinase
MRFVEPPHQILRKSLIQGLKLSTFAHDIAIYLSSRLFYTSALSTSGTAFRLKVAEWSHNTSMCALTEKVIFTDPYQVDPYNRWTSPQLDAFANSIRNDDELKLAVAELKEKFLSLPQALLHGDLHTGSVMAKEGSTFVIDPEFAFYGPMGFDIGALISNLLLNYFSHSVKDSADANAYADWLLEQLTILYQIFEKNFKQLWSSYHAAGAREGELFRPKAFNSQSLLEKAQEQYMSRLWKDSLGYTGCKMIRRVVGIAHVADIESIEDQDKRSLAEKRVLVLGRELVLSSSSFSATGPSFKDIQSLGQRAKFYYTKTFTSDNWPASMNE